MHPAYSVIVFTTASGAGYGLMIWLALLAAAGYLPATPGLGVVGLGLALSLITVGLLSSTLHLGRPERAWRAVSQWRTSWLSREGVLALATYIPAAVLGIGWVFFGTVQGVVGFAALLTVLLSVATVWSTGMIYRSLPTIRAWSQPVVPAAYLVLALATGALLLLALLAAFAIAAHRVAWVALALLTAAWLVKASYWRAIDRAPSLGTMAAATGLGRFGTVRPLDPPHTQANYVMREMGYVIARRHAERLRRIAVGLLFAAPAACLLLVLMLPPASGLARVLSFVAVASAGAGVLVERWLFFAEAEHVVMVYYTRDAA